MKNVSKFSSVIKLKTSYSDPDNFVSVVAYIYTDVTGMINSLETGLESKIKIN